MLSPEERAGKVAARNLAHGVAASLVRLRRHDTSEPWGVKICLDGNGHWTVWELSPGGLAERSGALRCGELVLDINGKAPSSIVVIEEVEASTRRSVTLSIARSERLLAQPNCKWVQKMKHTPTYPEVHVHLFRDRIALCDTSYTSSN